MRTIQKSTNTQVLRFELAETIGHSTVREAIDLHSFVMARNGWTEIHAREDTDTGATNVVYERDRYRECE